MCATVSRRMWVVYLALSRWMCTINFSPMLGFKVLSRILYMMVVSDALHSSDVVFVDTCGDLNVYFKDDSTFPGCCTPKFDTTITQKSGSCCAAPASETPVSPSIDLDQCSDLSMHFKNGSTSPGCCAPKPAQKSGGCCAAPASETPVNIFKDFDANSWVGTYCLALFFHLLGNAYMHLSLLS